MTKLRFIKPWGPYKPGDIKDNASGSTIHWLVDVYKFAVIKSDEPTIPEPIPEPEPERDIYKYVRKPQQHKMVTRAPKAKADQADPDERDE